jgi:NADPH:quinone reductase-like Zn-dependent oxidoreductase
VKAAVVTDAGKPPVYSDFKEPVAGDGECLIRVSAAALTQLTRGRASGTHYSSSGTFPFIAGVDGTGVLEDDVRVYFFIPEAPFGSMAERTVAKEAHCIALPEGLDDVTAAAIANPGMSSWPALTERAHLAKGETVLVNGATGTAGRLAVQIAKYLGAGRVIAAGRNAAVLQSLSALGADTTISLVQDRDTLEKQFRELFAGRVDVVLDYLWGESAQSILTSAAKAAPEGIPIRFVQIGSISGSTIALDGAILRSSSIEMLGSGIGSVPLPHLVSAIDGVFKATVASGFKIETEAVPLSALEDYWAANASGDRIVFTTGLGL